MSARPRPRVLHVDDDPAVRRAVERTLTAAGFTVAQAADGPEGLAAALRGRWALAILDVDLPGMSGFDVCARLRADPRTRAVPVLHLSAARVDVRDRVRGLERGADAYLVQPVAPEELVAVSRALVARGARARQGARPIATARTVAAAREEAFRIAAHVLRAPLSALSINAAGLSSAAADPVSRARAVAVVDAHAAVVQTLAELEELAWLETSREPLPLAPGIPADLAAGAARRVGAAAEAAGVQVVLGAAVPPPLRCDLARLEQALEAVLRRAIRAASRGGTVTLSSSTAGEVVRFSVAWTGEAGGDDARTHLAEELWGSRRPRNAPDVVALALARAVVLAHGGRIAADPLSPAVHVEIPASPFPAP